MTLQEFLKYVEETGVPVYSRGTSKIGRSVVHHFRPLQETDFLQIKWVIGGRSGGSCWSEGPQTYYAKTGEIEPDFKELDRVLLKFEDKLSFLRYKMLVADVVEVGSDSDGDYYGNSTEYATKTVELGKLYSKLVEHEIL